MGEKARETLKLQFDKRLRLEFYLEAAELRDRSETVMLKLYDIAW